MRQWLTSSSCVSLRTDYMAGPAKRCSIDAPRGSQTSITHRRGNISSTLPSGQSIYQDLYTNAPSALVHLVMSLRSERLVGDRLSDFGATAVPSACSLWQDHLLPSCPDFGSARRAHADREHRWRHVEHLLIEFPGILGLGGSLAVKLVQDDLFSACFGFDHTMAVLLTTFPSHHTRLPRLVLSRSPATLLLHCDSRITRDAHEEQHHDYPA